jgi:uncharacterized glyoxalase superfamily protein PhnB
LRARGPAGSLETVSEVCPNLGYRDARAAIRFLVDALGFEEVVVYESAPGDRIGYAELRRPGGGRITLHSAERHSIVDLATRAGGAGGDGSYPAFSIHVETDEPDGVYARAVAAGASIVRELQDSPLGTRGFVVSDPEGMYWSFGTPLPRLVRDEHGRFRPSAGPPRSEP